MGNSISYWWKIEERQGLVWKRIGQSVLGRWDWNNLPNGFGTYTHTDRTTYVGQDVDGLREGNGTWTLFDGSKFFGKWKNNRRWNGKSIDKEGNEIGRFVNGEEEIYYKPPF